jgi:hypothetical protein
MRGRGVTIAIALCVLAAAGCSHASRDRGTPSTHGTYDKTSGKLTEISYDRNHNGKIDTWTDMDGPHPLRSRVDLDEDGRIDRWEYYDASGALVKVGFSRKNTGKPDAWAFSNPDGSLEHVEVSSTADEGRIDRREYYERGLLVRVEEDTNGDGRPDKWERYDAGVLKTVEFDEDHDGKPDRRLTYANNEATSTERMPK